MLVSISAGFGRLRVSLEDATTCDGLYRYVILPIKGGDQNGARRWLRSTMASSQSKMHSSVSVIRTIYNIMQERPYECMERGGYLQNQPL